MGLILFDSFDFSVQVIFNRSIICFPLQNRPKEVLTMFDLAQTIMCLLITCGACINSPITDSPSLPAEEEILPASLMEPNSVTSEPAESLQLVRWGE